MTKEEAIRAIGWLKCTTNREDDLEAIDMAIEALSADAVHNGCFECKYLYNSADEHPCKSCKQNYLDMWEQKPNDFVSVVRCKDCRYYWGNLGEDDTDEMYGECRWDSDEMPNADDFCSYGERKEE